MAFVVEPDAGTYVAWQETPVFKAPSDIEISRRALFEDVKIASADEHGFQQE
ncbi:hypothetical protein [Tardiphaga sp.]|uniref:hypothetical protein n=1 Tax=Tardiphaga sp. TaxID=1926292 RepID=UPI00262C44CA|nr:hypothetical protein [Tardiphaga sp.]